MNAELHARDYMVYAYLQSGRDEAARQAIAEAQELASVESARPPGPFALAASPVPRRSRAGPAVVPRIRAFGGYPRSTAVNAR